MRDLRELMTAAVEHLTTFDLPEPVAVEVRDYDPAPLLVQLDGCQVAAGLLAWSDTLTSVSAHAWRPRTGTSVHLVILGSLPSDHGVKVFESVPYSTGVFGDLQPDGQTSVSLGVLREWAALDEVAA